MKQMILVDSSLVEKLDEKITRLTEIMLSDNKNEKEVNLKEKKIFTVKESANYLTMSEDFIRKRISSKEIKTIKIGGKSIRIEKEELDKLKNK